MLANNFSVYLIVPFLSVHYVHNPKRFAATAGNVNDSAEKTVTIKILAA
jgi:hypothetical protein